MPWKLPNEAFVKIMCPEIWQPLSLSAFGHLACHNTETVSGHTTVSRQWHSLYIGCGWGHSCVSDGTVLMTDHENRIFSSNHHLFHFNNYSMNLLALLPYSQFLACTFVLGTFQTTVLHPRKTWWARGGEEFQSWSFCLWELGCQQMSPSEAPFLPTPPPSVEIISAHRFFLGWKCLELSWTPAATWSLVLCTADV